ncbi:ribosomal protein L11 methyltransferase [Piscirickettsia salmonis]|uniref:Ribosome hibernation promoting factor n=1 Tax=Piscirickettsia salmonis TaxID=1238 RepID=A0A9Q5VGP0_PISSA|nr:ribosome-associated translation inhibitor RaiA [Piscirickettsia salmonis]OAJ34259.1 Ribosome hibernation promoting factor [Piscirickettsiaceae bacterium NZ-RLO1]RNC78585.1 ribosome-associated translation inhibitor RaiA [Piscirickettsiaceae bacterium NZ-RLO2]ALA24115.1 ribosomal subunit interface protein [Piscirickettsia salmonis]APS44516.1 ribosomal protein L11 methyltransferase [Piscirickettsia salmonis]APS47877.1 ribosomal protein L11 methyltransferase [Piscirickettsia salmonis]
MEINITARHLELTDPLNSYVNEKLTRLERHFDHITSIHVTLSVEKLKQRAEANLIVPGDQIVVKSAHDKDMYAAIDDMAKTLDNSLIRYKEKLQKKKANINYK